MKKYDYVIIGGGFYGLFLSLYLKDKKVLVLEKESDFMQKASYNNQARVHMGYHYPRSLMTSISSAINFNKFIVDFEPAIKNDFDKYYAISKIGSKVNAKQFNKIYDLIDTPITIASDEIKKIFNSRLIEEVFKVKEYAFDSDILKEILLKRILQTKNIELLLDTEVTKISKGINNDINISLLEKSTITSNYVFNCTSGQTHTFL